MPDFGLDDPLSAAVRGRGGLYNLSTATQPGQGSLDRQEPLLDQAIASRQDFENRRQYLFNRLQYGSRGERLRSGAELRYMETQERLAHQQALADQRQLDFEANQRRVMAHTNALEADRKWKTDRETDIDEHGAAMIQGLGQLRGALRNGRITEEQYQDGLLDLGQKYPYALRHPEAAKRYEFDVSEADKMRDFSQRRSIAESVKLASKYGVQPAFNETTGLPDLEATRSAVMQTPKFRLEALGQMNKEMFAKYGVGTGVSSLFNPIAPHTSPDKGQSIDIPFRDPKSGLVGKTTIPMPLFDTMKADFQDRYFSLVPQQPAAQPAQAGTSATDPRTELAQRALNDPNATEAHKQAARQILGIQENAQ